MKHVYRFTHVTVTVDHDAKRVETRFLRDGAIAVATSPGHYAEIDHADRLGYTDTWERCWVHEVGHSWLAEARTERWSLTLRAVADGVQRDHAKEINYEEAAVEALEAIRFQVPDFMRALAEYEEVA